MDTNKFVTFAVTLSLIVSVGAMPVLAQTKTATSSATADDETDEDTSPTPTKKVSQEEKEKVEAIEEIKDKVESKVSQLTSNNKSRAGFIMTIEDDKMTLEGENGNFDVEVDKDVTTSYRIEGGKTSEVDFEDVKKGDYVLVSGPEIGSTITANAIYIDEHFFVKSGKIIEVNSESFYIKVQTLEKDQFILDVERSSTQQILDIKTLELESVGFSKLKEGDNIHFVAKRGPDKKQTRFSIVKSVIIPQEYFIK